jgi:hypothetical protein
MLFLAPPARADVVVPDDQIVQGALCAGLDCVNNEIFGFDTLRLKENNTRIAFDDTSTGAGFPNNDWALQANETISGGRNLFFLQDITGSKMPFAVTAGAPTNSLFVGSSGNLGVGTDTPGLGLSLRKGDTPAVRMEQDTSSGFSAQTWDIGANDANWFVRDQTGGNRLPFRIRPGAPTSAIDIAASGNVGVGTATPAFPIDAVRTNVTGPMQRLSNKGAAQLRFENTDAGANAWDVGGSGDKTSFGFTPAGGTPALKLTPGGDATTAGALQQNADPAATENGAPVDASDVLAKIRALTLTRSELKTDPANAVHVGPTGADFRAAFGLGSSDAAIAPADLAGVSLVGLQALAARVDDLDTSAVGGLTARLDALKQAVDALSGHGTQIRQLVTFGQATDTRVKALEKSNKALLKRLGALDKKVRKLSKTKR